MVRLVLTAYSPYEHYLELLGSMAADDAPSLAGVFPMEMDEQSDRFRLLESAYVDARYDGNYRISAEDLEYFVARVRILLDRTDAIRKKTLEHLTGDAWSQRMNEQ